MTDATKSSRSAVRWTAALCTAAVFGSAAGAQTAANADQVREGQAPAEQPPADPSIGVAEILVTAQRREERVQDVPIAISAFTAAELDARGVTSMVALTQTVPNLIGHNNTGLGSANTYFLRGLGSTESLATADAPVGTYVDEIFVARQSANNFSLFNVARIEVLRGPQGTLFGRNTTGGAINIVLAQPRDELGGFAEVGYGSFDRFTARASLDLPVSDQVAVNLSGYFIDDQGFVTNTTTGERLNRQHSLGVRGAILIRPADGVRWNLSGMYTKEVSSNILNYDCDPANPGRCDGRFANTGLRENTNGQSQFPTLALSAGKGSLPLGAETRFGLLSSNLAIDVSPETTLSFITGYVYTGQDFLIDFFDGRAAPAVNYTLDPTTGRPTSFNRTGNVVSNPPVARLATGGFVIANLADTDQFSQEVKLVGRLGEGLIDYVAGLFYFHEKTTTDFADILTSALTRNPTLLADRTVTNKTTAYAGYAQADVNITDKLKLTAGVRYTDETKRFSFADNRPACQVTPLPATCISDPNFTDVVFTPTLTSTIPLSQTTRIWTPRFVANYRPADNVLLFASATRGFKSGSQAARATAVRNLLPFGPEKIWSYEVGLKSDLFDRRLRLNVTGFHFDDEGFQGGTAFINPATGALTFVTGNLGGLRNTGVEIEMVAVPVRNLTLTVNAGWQDARYVIDRNAPVVNQFNLQSVAAQQAECVAALAGAPSPRNDARTAVARAQSNCGNGLVTPTGAISQPTRTPAFTFAATLAYELELGTAGSLTPSVDFIHYSSQEVGTGNLTIWRNAAGVENLARDGVPVSGSFQPAYSLVNATLTWRNPGSDWTVQLVCANCTDQAAFQSTLSNYSYLNPPRTWLARVMKRF
jgi:iron complex outermembrane receptor protein